MSLKSEGLICTHETCQNLRPSSTTKKFDKPDYVNLSHFPQSWEARKRIVDGTTIVSSHCCIVRYPPPTFDGELNYKHVNQILYE